MRGNNHITARSDGEAEAVIEMYVFAEIALLVAGVTIGVFVTVCLGINRDDRPGGFPAHTNDQIARAGPGE
jgi:hypothetical protein